MNTFVWPFYREFSSRVWPNRSSGFDSSVQLECLVAGESTDLDFST